MRIGLNLLYMLPGVVGGTETYAAGLLTGLAEVEREHEFVVFVNQEAHDWPLPEPANFLRVVCPLRATNRAQRYYYEQCHLPALAKKQGIELLHSLGYVGPLLPPCASVVTVHDLNFMSDRHVMPLLRRNFLEFFCVHSAQHAQIVITVSNFSKKLICRKLNISQDKVTVIWEGERTFASPRDFTDIKSNIFVRYGITGPYIAAFAGGAAHKNIPRLLRAYEILKKSLPHQLVLIGHMPANVRTTALPKGVIATGYIPNEHVIPLLRGAAVFVLPSLYEGFGLPILEAQQAGVPVVSSMACSLPEVAGDAALFFNPYSVEEMATQIRRVALDAELQQNLRRRGFENLKRFSWENAAVETLDAYARAYELYHRKTTPTISPPTRISRFTREHLILAIDASNIGSGGSLGHLEGFLRHADFAGHGFNQVQVWCNRMVEKYLGNFERKGVFIHPQKELDGSVAGLIRWQTQRLPKLLEECQPDILWAPGGIGIKQDDGIPRVMLLQNVLPFDLEEARRYGWRFAYWKLLTLRQVQKHAFRSAEGVMFLSEYSKERVLNVLPKIRQSSVVIPHGIDEIFFRPAPQPRWPEKLPVRLLYVSTVDVYKHQWQLCKAVDELIGADYKLDLDIVGGAYPPALRRLNQAMQQMSHSAGHVHYRGSIPHAKLPEIYHAADIFVFPSSCEAMPIVVLEAMASGLPIACSNRGPMPEILGDSGVYFDPEKPAEIAEAIRQLIDNPAMAFEMAQRAHLRAKEYSWHRCAQETLTYLHKIIKQ